MQVYQPDGSYPAIFTFAQKQAVADIKAEPFAAGESLARLLFRQCSNEQKTGAAAQDRGDIRGAEPSTSRVCHRLGGTERNGPHGLLVPGRERTRPAWQKNRDLHFMKRTGDT